LIDSLLLGDGGFA